MTQAAQASQIAAPNWLETSYRWRLNHQEIVYLVEAGLDQFQIYDRKFQPLTEPWWKIVFIQHNRYFLAIAAQGPHQAAYLIDHRGQARLFLPADNFDHSPQFKGVNDALRQLRK